MKQVHNNQAHIDWTVGAVLYINRKALAPTSSDHFYQRVQKNCFYSTHAINVVIIEGMH